MIIEGFIENITNLVSVIDNFNVEESEITLTFNQETFNILLNHFNGSIKRNYSNTNNFKVVIDKLTVNVKKSPNIMSK